MNTARQERASLRRYAEAIALWNARFDTAAIAERLNVAESIVARWVANFREQARAINQQDTGSIAA